MDKDVIVLKFGGASVSSPEQFFLISDIILKVRQSHQKVIVVVSAMGDTTNKLIELAKQVNPEPPKREYDMLVTSGERISISLLAMALAAKGQAAVSFTGSQSGIITCTGHCEARIINVRPHRLLTVLHEDKIAIVAGFQGVSTLGEITTLGRGGSDTTAVALGVALGAVKVVFFKDVPGVFSEDPKVEPGAQFFSALSYDSAMAISARGDKILHYRCLELAKKNSLPLHVRSFADYDSLRPQGTLISASDRLPPRSPVYEDASQNPLKLS